MGNNWFLCCHFMNCSWFLSVFFCCWLLFWFSKASINFLIFSQTKFFIRYENFVIVPNGSRPDFQAHIARQCINIFSNAVVSFTRCVTRSVLVTLDIFLNVYSAIYDILEIIQKSRSSCQSTSRIPNYRRSSRGLRT